MNLPSNSAIGRATEAVYSQELETGGLLNGSLSNDRLSLCMDYGTFLYLALWDYYLTVSDQVSSKLSLL